jgi:hypothetical protein
MMKSKLKLGRKPSFDIEEAKRLYADLRSLQKVAEELGVKRPAISKALKKAGVELQPRGRQEKPDAEPSCIRGLRYRERLKEKNDLL